MTTIRTQAIPKFPASVEAGDGIVIERSGGVFTFSVDPAFRPSFSGALGAGKLLVSDGPTSVAGIADVAAGNVLLSGGVGAPPAYGKVGLGTHVSGVLPVASGGTNYTGGALPISAPIPTPGSGAFSAVSCSMAALTIGKLQFNFTLTTITNHGTAGQWMSIPLPAAVKRHAALNAYRVSDNTPGGGYASSVGNSLIVFKYDGTTLINIDGGVISTACLFETA